MCLRRFTVSVNPRPQWGQRYGFSPVWVRWCVLRLCDAMKPFPQSWHTNGLSPTGNNDVSLKYSAINAYKFCMKSCHPGRIQTPCTVHYTPTSWAMDDLPCDSKKAHLLSSFPAYISFIPKGKRTSQWNHYPVKCPHLNLGTYSLLFTNYSINSMPLKATPIVYFSPPYSWL